VLLSKDSTRAKTFLRMRHEGMKRKLSVSSVLSSRLQLACLS